MYTLMYQWLQSENFLVSKDMLFSLYKYVYQLEIFPATLDLCQICMPAKYKDNPDSASFGYAIYNVMPANAII